MPTEYYDFAAGVDGTGTISNPYNNVSHIQAYKFGGDLGGLIFAIKANGGKVRDFVKFVSTSNCKFMTYGTGERPIFDGSDVFSTTWTYDGANDVYYADATLYYKLYGDGIMFLAVADLANCALNEGTQWYDSGNSRMYVNTGAENANSMSWERTNVNVTDRWTPLLLTAGSNIELEYIHVKRGHANNIAATSHGDGLIISNCRSDEAGGWENNQGRDGIIVYGTDDVAGALTVPATNVQIINNEINYAGNNTIELWGVDAAVIEGNTGAYNGGGMELWGYVTNCNFTQNKLVNIGLGRWPAGNAFVNAINVQQSGIYIADAAATGNFNRGFCSNDTFTGNLFHSDTGKGIWIDNGAGHVANNNTIVASMDTQIGSKPGTQGCIRLNIAGTGAELDVNNNIFYAVFPAGAPTTSDSMIKTDATSVLTGDNNCYFTSGLANNFGKAYIGAATYDGFAAYQAGVITQDVESFNIDPLFANIDKLDFARLEESPCIGIGVRHWAGKPNPVGTDGEPFSDMATDIGDYQSVYNPRHPVNV